MKQYPKLINVRLSDGTWIKISNQAKKEKRTISNMVRVVLETIFK